MKYIVGNWKMNQTLSTIRDFFLVLEKTRMEFMCQAWIAPQFVHVPIVKDLAFTLGKIKVGAQNCSEYNNGAYTGDVSASTLADLGISFVIIGHSERRSIFKETHEMLKIKTALCFENNMKVIFCVGETLAERKSGQTLNVLKTQLEQGLKGLKAKPEQLLIAYEPVWAIGTGEAASAGEASEAHRFIRQELATLFPGIVIPILYGGSVKPDNIKDFLAQEAVDGALVGGASLKGEDFKALCNHASIFS